MCVVAYSTPAGGAIKAQVQGFKCTILYLQSKIIYHLFFRFVESKKKESVESKYTLWNCFFFFDLQLKWFEKKSLVVKNL